LPTLSAGECSVDIQYVEVYTLDFMDGLSSAGARSVIVQYVDVHTVNSMDV